MAWNIRFTKEHIARAREKGRHSFAVGYEGHGHAEAFMWLKPDDATFVWLFTHEVNSGKTPSEAFAAVEQRIAEHAAKLAAKEAAKEPTPVPPDDRDGTFDATFDAIYDDDDPKSPRSLAERIAFENDDPSLQR